MASWSVPMGWRSPSCSTTTDIRSRPVRADLRDSCLRHGSARTTLTTMATDPADKNTSPASFEASITRLTHIVEQLERGELPLEDSLRLFEEGVSLSRTSQLRL